MAVPAMASGAFPAPGFILPAFPETDRAEVDGPPAAFHVETKGEDRRVTARLMNPPRFLFGERPGGPAEVALPGR